MVVDWDVLVYEVPYTSFETLERLNKGFGMIGHARPLEQDALILSWHFTPANWNCHERIRVLHFSYTDGW